MTKADLVEQVTASIARTAGPMISKKDCARVVDAFLEAVKEALKQQHNIEVRGFGTFKIRRRKTRMARNPRTGDPVEVAARPVPVFKPSKELRALVADEGEPAGGGRSGHVSSFAPSIEGRAGTVAGRPFFLSDFRSTLARLRIAFMYAVTLDPDRQRARSPVRQLCRAARAGDGPGGPSRDRDGRRRAGPTYAPSPGASGFRRKPLCAVNLDPRGARYAALRG